MSMKEEIQFVRIHTTPGLCSPRVIFLVVVIWVPSNPFLDILSNLYDLKVQGEYILSCVTGLRFFIRLNHMQLR